MRGAPVTVRWRKATSGGNTGGFGSRIPGDISSAHHGEWHLTAPTDGQTKKAIAMRGRHMTIGTRLKWPAMIAPLAALFLVSAVPGEARVRVFISPGIMVPFGPFWTPYAEPYVSPYRYPYAYPPVIVQPPPRLYVHPPPPPPIWYYCENPQGYYPYVQHCPGGWRQVPATPP
jgi:hypothetical protein